MKTAMKAPTITYTCARCSRTSTDINEPGWSIRPWKTEGGADFTAVVCGPCLVGVPVQEDGEKTPCGGKCKGDFRPKVGTYFEAVLEGSWSSNDETWACWDEACVEAWAEEHGGDCETCGHDRDVDITQYENGKRVRR